MSDEERLEELRVRLQGYLDSEGVKSMVVVGESQQRFFFDAFAEGGGSVLSLIGQLEVAKGELIKTLGPKDA